MEFCEHGNLRQFLRDSRDRYNKDEEFLMNDLSLDFGPKNLIQLAYQITKGMAFLVSRKVTRASLRQIMCRIVTQHIVKSVMNNIMKKSLVDTITQNNNQQHFLTNKMKFLCH